MPNHRKPPAGQRYKNFVTVAEEHAFISPLVQIGQFKENCKCALPEGEINFRNRRPFTAEHLSEEMEVTEDVIRELESVCSPSSLTCPLEDKIADWEDVVNFPDGADLVTLEHWKHSSAERKDTLSKSRRLLRSKYTEMACSLMENAYNTPPRDESDKIQCPEIVITVTVFFPRDHRRFKSSGVDYLVLGSQKLSELRDKIPCALAEQPLGNFTDNPDHPTDIKLKDVCTSSLFFIENTFYNDLRSPSSIDLSKLLIEWSQKYETVIPPEVDRVDMESVAFEDLYIRFGCPYIFLHLGDCEHLVIFKDIKLFDPTDCQSRCTYPITISRAFFKANPCDLCGLHTARWATVRDELAQRDPSVFCDTCFKLLHYDKLGNKLGNFVAFPRVNIAELDY